MRSLAYTDAYASRVSAAVHRLSTLSFVTMLSHSLPTCLLNLGAAPKSDSQHTCNTRDALFGSCRLKRDAYHNTSSGSSRNGPRTYEVAYAENWSSLVWTKNRPHMSDRSLPANTQRCKCHSPGVASTTAKRGSFRQCTTLRCIIPGLPTRAPRQEQNNVNVREMPTRA